MLLASLVVAAGFAVVAQRRLRQLGMLASLGATHKHLRLVLLTNGALVGTIAAISGTIVGLVLWLVVAPTLESAVDHRVERLSVPWELIAMTVAARDPRGHRRRLVAGANGRPPPDRARALGPTAEAEAGTPRRRRGRGPDRGRRSACLALSGPRPAAADRRRNRDDDPRLPAPRSAGDSRLLRLGRASLDRAAVGPAGPRPLPGPFRGGAGGGHARARHRRDGRHHHVGGARQGGRRAAQPVRPADPRSTPARRSFGKSRRS